ncbi:MAG: DNA repair protein RadC [Defluviitaleaceae bacterium]|nr:DNA repair protein RadC [Defluviitaleaceae bacterium]
MNPHENHRKRMRRRYIKQGFESFADHEVLEFLLFYCYPRRDTNEIAHRMIKEFGSLHNLLESDVATIMKKLNCTENIAVFLNMLPKAANRYFRNKWGEGAILDNEKTAGEYTIDLFVGHTVEMFYVLCLDKKFRIINAVMISEGTVDESAVYPREIVGAAIQNNAAYIILTHNHPGGTLRPSRGDLEVTRRVVDGLQFLNLTVVDHIIVAGDTYYSFAARKQLVNGYV